MHGVESFLSNLTYTDTIVNDLLQLKFRNGANDLARLLLQPEPPGP